ncbi:GrpB family protein [Flectobacillus sp. BAB-3569]|uniref:GrpB family protein n=1 Tax=Flectobacillus sp. BAB-3569 TaxID=1509483 RepID=UPI000BA4DA64|nr:GrpB family protein [Flectobacillus sp. BAB-3569]PAC26722.1 hypothetical protein BWI92_25040 [Flectobacillus sp. BAB-3569]
MISFIEPHNPNWKTEFNNLKSKLLTVLGDLKVDIQHVGSTAIPNLFAKPILDIDIIIDHKTLLDDITARLIKIGYIDRGEQGIPGRFAFRQSSVTTPHTDDRKKWQEHHLYVCFSDSLALKNHLLFRDALLNDQELAAQYSTLKLNLIREIDMTREKYTKQKTDFIISVLSELGFDKTELNNIINANL